MESLVINLLNGTSYGLLLFMLSSGLTLISSMMGVLNSAHASFYMLGAYLVYVVSGYLGFWSASIVTPLLAGALGVVVEHFGLCTVYRYGHVAELPFTLGLAYLIEEGVKLVWGLPVVPYCMPDVLDGPLFTLLMSSFLKCHAFTMSVPLLMLVGIFLLLTCTRIGFVI